MYCYQQVRTIEILAQLLPLFGFPSHRATIDLFFCTWDTPRTTSTEVKSNHGIAATKVECTFGIPFTLNCQKSSENSYMMSFSSSCHKKDKNLSQWYILFYKNAIKIILLDQTEEIYHNFITIFQNWNFSTATSSIWIPNPSHRATITIGNQLFFCASDTANTRSTEVELNCGINKLPHKLNVPWGITFTCSCQKSTENSSMMSFFSFLFQRTEACITMVYLFLKKWTERLLILFYSIMVHKK